MVNCLGGEAAWAGWGSWNTASLGLEASCELVGVGVTGDEAADMHVVSGAYVK
jgi:hypothetical protein